MNRDIFAKEKQAWLETARAEARRLLRKNYEITIEDVLAEVPLPDYLNRNTIGHVFLSPEFKKVGYTTAKHAAANHRVIAKWKMKGEWL